MGTIFCKDKAMQSLTEFLAMSAGALHPSANACLTLVRHSTELVQASCVGDCRAAGVSDWYGAERACCEGRCCGAGLRSRLPGENRKDEKKIHLRVKIALSGGGWSEAMVHLRCKG